MDPRELTLFVSAVANTLYECLPAGQLAVLAAVLTQHGLPALKIADLTCDIKLLKEAQGAALELLEKDPELISCPAAAERVEDMFGGGAGAMN